MAHLRDGTRLHIDSLGVGEKMYDFGHLLLGIHKPVACDNQTRLRTGQLRLLQQIGISLIAGGKSLYLSIDGRVVDGLATIHIVVGQFRTHDDILKVDVIAITAGTAAGNDTVGFVLTDHLYGLYGCVDSGDAALLQDQLVFWKQRTELLVLLVHCYNHTYFHILHDGIKSLILTVSLSYRLVHENGSRDTDIQGVEPTQHGDADMGIGSLAPLVG